MLNILVPGTLLTLISVVYLFGVAPDMTWVGLAGDSPDYVTSAMKFERAGLAAYPLFISIGWVFEQVFHYGLGFNPYWSLGLLSAIPTVITCGFIYGTIRLYSTSFLPAIVSTLAYGGSLLVWSQSVVPEVYSITVMFMVIGIYYLLKAYREERPKLLYVSALILGLSLSTHPLAVFAAIPGLIYVLKVPLDNRPSVLQLLFVGSLGLIPWVQFFLTSSTNTHSTGLSVNGLSWIISTLGHLGGLPVYPVGALVIRLQDFLSMVGLGLCILIPSYILGSVSLYKGDRRLFFLLVSIIVLPLLVYMPSTIPQWITYTLPSIAFLSILGGLCSIKYLDKYEVKGGLVVASVCGLGLLGLNLYSYDIGRNIDPSPTTMRQAYDKLETLPTGSVIYTHTWGHMGVLVGVYNRHNNNRLQKFDSTLEPINIHQVLANKPLSFKPSPPIRDDTPKTSTNKIYDELLRMDSLFPGKEVFVAYLQNRSTVEFDYISASDYRHSLNDVPELTEAIDRRVRVH